MMARKKLEVLQVDVSNSLEHRLSKVVSDPFILEIMEKDRRLIEAALIGDKRVASLDDKVRDHFRAHRNQLPEVRSIYWVNPDVSHVEVCEWLRSGAPNERRLSLGFRPAEPRS